MSTLTTAYENGAVDLCCQLFLDVLKHGQLSRAGALEIFEDPT
jgi:hypothetical protein